MDSSTMPAAPVSRPSAGFAFRARERTLDLLRVTPWAQERRRRWRREHAGSAGTTGGSKRLGVLPVLETTKPAPVDWCGLQGAAGGGLLSHRRPSAVPSTLAGLTAV